MAKHPISARRKLFDEKFSNLSDKELQLQNLYWQQIQIETLEKIRYNTNIMVWWLIVIPIIAGIILLLLTSQL